MSKVIMIQGTMSNAGKSLVAAGLCRVFRQDGLRVEDIVAFLLYLGLFYGPVTGLANLLENMQQSMAGAEREIAEHGAEFIYHR